VATSRLPALKAVLKTLCEAQSGLSGVLVSYGWPKDPRRELIVLGDAEISQEYRGIGAAIQSPQPAKREEIDLTVLVSVVGETTAQQSTRAGPRAPRSHRDGPSDRPPGRLGR